MLTKLTPIFAAGLLAAGAAQAVSLPASGYTQNFDSMLASGTAAPTDWRVFNGEAGTSNSTWTTSISANGASGSVSSMVLSTAALSVATAPTANANNGYNAAVSAATASDRILATAPTTISGTALELSLTNNTGFSFDALSIGYETVRFTSVGTANQLPGYQLFFNVNGSWANAENFNPTLTTVPNTVGVSPFSGLLTLGTSVAPGATVLLRWVDDNAQQTSPDQVIGLNNVSISAVPEPQSVALMLAGLMVMGWMAQRRANSKD